MADTLEQRLRSEYHFSPCMARAAMKLHATAEGRSYVGKMALIILSPFASCYPKTQQAVYEILAMGPKEDAYKISIWKAVDPKGYAFILATYAASLAMQHSGINDNLPSWANSVAKDGASWMAYSMLAENAVVATASLITKRPLPRPLAHKDNPVLWLDSLRIARNGAKSLYTSMQANYASLKKSAACIFLP